MTNRMPDATSRTYWIGGSPCCGKSTIAELLVRECQFALYKCDDHLDRYIDIGAAQGVPFMVRLKGRTLDEIWLRSVRELVDDEFEYYRIALRTISQEVAAMPRGRHRLVEGAAVLPEFACGAGVPKNRYLCMVPTADFQMEHFSRRKWLGQYLQGCSDPRKAFENWMRRDIIYASTIKRMAERYGFHVISVDGSRPVTEIYAEARSVFELDEPSVSEADANAEST